MYEKLDILGFTVVNILYIVIVILVVLTSMTFHEAMHAFVGYWLGDDTAKLQGRLTLNPIKHLDPFLSVLLPITLALIGAPIFGGAKPVPFNPKNVKWGEWGVALVALAGPITNFLVAFVSFGIWVVIGLPSTGIVGQIFTSIISINLGFFIFNMIPIPPLDGSRILYALAPEFVRRGMEAIERFGTIVIFGIILLSGSAIGIFISSAITFFVNLFANFFGL